LLLRLAGNAGQIVDLIAQVLRRLQDDTIVIARGGLRRGAASLRTAARLELLSRGPSVRSSRALIPVCACRQNLSHRRDCRTLDTDAVHAITYAGQYRR
jgi:hypothetical protein